ncbi:MAG TPA: tetratricopeptide repeat-containing glycosyltransferase family protein [Burkholderiales bacterium]|jgi:tetratricopeptide (TPR) repeat protein|nr:tetratricopeptide repeat-containing glycosyltransferase family protein [Burkholderiales bacterium]
MSVLLQEARRHRERGALDEARRCCEALLASEPGHGDASELMAAIAADAGQFAEGLRWAQAAIAANPRSGAPYFTLGRLYQAEGRLEDAAQSYRRCLSLSPERASAHNNLGSVLQLLGKLDLALASYRRALELDPSLPQANQNVAALARDAAAAEAAIAGYQRAAQANPQDAQALVDLGNTYRELGRHSEALESFARALERSPSLPEAHFARSLELLLCGDYPQGWEEYEWRWKVKALNTPLRKLDAPLWDGRALPGGTVLLHAEQGFGDTLLFARYASLVAERCSRVVLECQSELASLLARTPGVHQVVAAGHALPPCDAHLPLMSLPRVFRTTLDSVPWTGPYVLPDAARAAESARLASAPGLRVGLVWAGRPQQGDDRKRSCSLAMMAPLARAAGATFYSLQKGPPASQAAAPPRGMTLVDLESHIGDFEDTAALIANLDLVITVDTSVANLAGALGRPTWVLLSTIPDWRYHLGREDTPWYPAMRLFRQSQPGDWTAPLDQAARALATLASGRG